MMNEASHGVTRFTGSSAIIGGILAFTNVALSLAVTGSDAEMVLHGATMLALPADTRDLFRLSMLADIFGFYLAILVIGGYFLYVFRERLGALCNMIGLAIGLYAMLGIAGAAVQLAIYHPLAHLYAGGDDATRATAAAVWTATAHAVQNGLWWAEAPLVFFWTPIAAKHLKQAGFKGSFLLRIVGWSFGLLFLFAYFESLEVLAGVSELVFVIALPLWMLWFGCQLLGRAGKSVQLRTVTVR
ncbi:hypothetical protein I5586_23395 [Burkholderia multivorans]|nr:hypothetical protein [Burkholderia multivorans]